MSIQKMAANGADNAVRGLHDYLGSSAMFTKAEREAGEKMNKLASEALQGMQSKKTPVDFARPDALVYNSATPAEPVVKVVRGADGYTSPFAIITDESKKTLAHEATKAEVGAKLDIVEGHLFG